LPRTGAGPGVGERRQGDENGLAPLEDLAADHVDSIRMQRVVDLRLVLTPRGGLLAEPALARRRPLVCALPEVRLEVPAVLRVPGGEVARGRAVLQDEAPVGQSRVARRIDLVDPLPPHREAARLLGAQ